MIPANIDLSVIAGNNDPENAATFTPDMTYLDIKDLDVLIANLSKYRLPTLEND